MKVFSGGFHVERMDNDRIAKIVYVGECAGRRSVGRPRKKGIDAVKECLRKRGLDVRQARRMVQNRSEWREFVRVNPCCGLPLLCESFGWKSVCDRAYNLKGIKETIYFSFLSFVSLLLLYIFMVCCVPTPR